MIIARPPRDFRLTTAEILYHLPDHPALLQSYIWQNLDEAPRFPALHRFLEFWTREIDGKLHSIRLATCEGLTPARLRYAQHLLTLQ